MTTDPAQRIVSLVPSMTETVCALGAVGRLAGITRYCEEPAALLRDLPRVGGTKNPKLDDIAALRPDLVLVNSEENRAEDIAWLRERFPVLEHRPRTVLDAAVAVRELAQALGRLPQAQPILLLIEAQIARAETEALGRQPLRVYYAIWKKPWMSCNADTYIHDVLQRAGAVNVCATDGARYPEVSPEEAAARGVDAVLLSSEPYPFTEACAAEVEAQGLFGEGTRVVWCDGRDFCWHGARTADGLGRAVSLVKALRRER